MTDHEPDLWEGDPTRETTFVVRIYGLGEPITTCVPVCGHRFDRMEQVCDEVAAIAAAVLERHDLVACTAMSDGDQNDVSGVVADAAHVGQWSTATRHAVAWWTATDTAVDQIETWLTSH